MAAKDHVAPALPPDETERSEMDERMRRGILEPDEQIAYAARLLRLAPDYELPPGFVWARRKVEWGPAFLPGWGNAELQAGGIIPLPARDVDEGPAWERAFDPRTRLGRPGTAPEPADAESHEKASGKRKTSGTASGAEKGPQSGAPSAEDAWRAGQPEGMARRDLAETSADPVLPQGPAIDRPVTDEKHDESRD